MVALMLHMQDLKFNAPLEPSLSYKYFSCYLHSMVQPVPVTTLEAKQQLCGNMTLYFGCRQSDMDFIYKEELKSAEESGALSAVHVALSRQPAQPKVYMSYNSAGL